MMPELYLPYNGRVKLASKYGYRTLNGVYGWHAGVDLVGQDSKTILAPCDGKIVSSLIITDKNNKTWEWGNYVRLDRADGLKIFMCHMSQRLVTAGQTVKRGDPIGIEGNTGYSFGSHCHFEVRKGSSSVDPTPYLGIKNEAGTYKNEEAATIDISRPDSYTKNSLKFRRCKTFRIVYHDSKKVGANYLNYLNGGFFGNFKSASGVVYTLPVGNLVCDPWHVPAEGQADILPHVTNGKLRWGCQDNHSKQFSGKKVSTLVVPAAGKPYIEDLNAPPANCLYAISGVPTVRNGDDVDYYNYVKAQGWDDSCMYATWRNWLGVRNGEIWIINGKTTSNNYIYGMEFWKKVKDEGFDDIICLDGGGSEIYKAEGVVQRTYENRRINNLVVFE